MTKIQMPEDTRLHSPKKAIFLTESILKIEYKMKDPSLSDKEREALNDNQISLLKKSSIELTKPSNPMLMPEEEKKYFREPYLSYFAELGREMQKFSNIKPRKARKAKKKRTKEIFELPTGTDEDIERIFRLMNRDSFRHFKHMQYLDHLKFTDKEEFNERGLRCEMELFSTYLISRFIALKFDLIKATEEWKRELIQQELNKKEIQIDYYERSKFILDHVIKISLHLNNEDLTEEQRTSNNQEREEYRHGLKALQKDVMVKALKSGVNMEDEFEKFRIKEEQLLKVIRQYKEHLERIRDFKRLKNLDWRHIN